MFVGSYFFKRPALLRATQMSGAALWIVYGALIGAIPVVVANGLVFARGRIHADPSRQSVRVTDLSTARPWIQRLAAR